MSYGTHGLARTVEYKAWQSIKERCLNTRCGFYDRYGGRGILIYEGWINDPCAFIAHMGPRPSKRHSVDRIDNMGNYVPGNLKWSTFEEQNRNRRCSKLEPIDIEFIRHWKGLGYGQKAIGLAFGVAQSHICRIYSGKVWAEAPASKDAERKDVSNFLA
jgi:hypothetical protein